MQRWVPERWVPERWLERIRFAKSRSLMAMIESRGVVVRAGIVEHRRSTQSLGQLSGYLVRVALEVWVGAVSEKRRDDIKVRRSHPPSRRSGRRVL
ncbi:hypothetical protein [Nonomuraea sp. KM90]|uniref:hypothetical protein n=1 Tax=Nonomuraea sp. KM90 TaxID=3457428 RepID=UPI003FCC9DAA